MNRRLLFTITILLFLITTAACGPKGADYAPADTQPPAPTQKVEATPLPVSEDESLHAAGVADTGISQGEPPTERMVIHTVQLSLIVDDVEVTLPQVMDMVQHMQGYIVYSNAYRTYADRLAATVTLRVPADRLDEALDQLRGMAWKVSQEQRSGEDVTDEYVDLEARLTVLQATEQELLALLGEVRQSEGNAEEKAQAILAIYEQLTVVRSQIEQIQGRMQYLGQMAAMATITVDLSPRDPQIDQPVVEEGFRPGRTFREAASTLVSIFQGLVNGLIWLVTIVLPVVAVIAIVIGVPIGLIRRWRRRRREQIS